MAAADHVARVMAVHGTDMGIRFLVHGREEFHEEAPDAVMGYTKIQFPRKNIMLEFSSRRQLVNILSKFYNLFVSAVWTEQGEGSNQ